MSIDPKANVKLSARELARFRRIWIAGPVADGKHFGMGCFVFLLSLIGPRLALGYVWIFTTLVDRAYDNVAVPVLGFVFLPWTTLIYALSYDGSGVSGIGWFFVALGLFADVSSHAAAAQRRRQMRAA